MDKTLAHFQTLVEIVSKLRHPQTGCPWDLQQDQQSLTQYAIEEAYELVEAIESEDQKEIQEELGDFLFQVILQSQVAQDEGHFSLENVLSALNEKMIRRHPHVFSEKADTSIPLTEVWKNWEKLKADENLQKKPKAIFSYPRSMPALQAAYKIGVKTEAYRFDWQDAKQVFEKVREEFLETEQALKQNDIASLKHEIGDLLFSAAQLARHADLEPEQCLREANRRFEERFSAVLKLAEKKFGAEFSKREKFAELESAQMEELWSQVKKDLLEKKR
jgi:tetrapyrrole methylase family protein/MazG family protein